MHTPRGLLFVLALSTTIAISFSVEPKFYEQETNLLNKIFKNYDPAKAEQAFLANNGTIYLYPSLHFIIEEFSEVHLSGRGSIIRYFIYKDYTLPPWSRNELGGRSILNIRKPQLIWRPPSPEESFGKYNGDKGAIMHIRSDGYILYYEMINLDFRCFPMSNFRTRDKEYKSKGYYPHEHIGCLFHREIKQSYKKWRYECKKKISFFSNVSFAELEPCDAKEKEMVSRRWQRWNWIQTMKDWKIFYTTSRGAIFFTLIRKYSHNYAVDVLSCVSFAILLIIQFCVPLSIFQRVGMGLFGILIASSTNCVISELDMLLQRGSPRLMSISLALFTLQCMAMLWAVLACTLQDRKEFQMSSALSYRLSSMMVWLRKLEAYRSNVDRMQRLMEESDISPESPDDPEVDQQKMVNCTWPLLIRCVDCAFGLVCLISMLIVFGYYLG